MKILTIDIETSPCLGYIWGLWDQNVSLQQLVEVTEMMCFCAKWVGEKDVTFKSTFHEGKKSMVRAAWKLLDEADVVVHFNGKRFDIPHLNREFMEQGLTPPSPFKQVDLLQVVKQQFKLPSNKLEYVSKWLGLSGKLSHTGFKLWQDCIHEKPEAWELMEKYNIQDVMLTEEAYHKLVPWINGHPNHNLFKEEDTRCCPNCGSSHMHQRGYAYTGVSRFQRYRCMDCGKWSRSRTNTVARKNANVGVI